MIIFMVKTRRREPDAEEMATQKADISMASANAKQGDITTTDISTFNT